MKVAAKARKTGQATKESPTWLVEENGVSAYVVEAKTYEAMQRRLRLLEGLAKGEQAVAEGRVVSHSRAKKRLARWLK